MDDVAITNGFQNVGDQIAFFYLISEAERTCNGHGQCKRSNLIVVHGVNRPKNCIVVGECIFQQFQKLNLIFLSPCGRFVEDYVRLDCLWPMGAFTVKGAKIVVKCNVILYHVYFERQVCVIYLFKLLLLFSVIYIYIYLMILIFQNFEVISLSFESPFMHIKHLKYSCQIML